MYGGDGEVKSGLVGAHIQESSERQGGGVKGKEIEKSASRTIKINHQNKVLFYTNSSFF